MRTCPTLQLTIITVKILLTGATQLKILFQNAMICVMLKQLAKDMTKHVTYEIFQWIGCTLLHTAPVGWWSSTDGAHLVFHNLNFIYHAKQYRTCISIRLELQKRFEKKYNHNITLPIITQILSSKYADKMLKKYFS